MKALILFLIVLVIAGYSIFSSGLPVTGGAVPPMATTPRPPGPLDIVLWSSDTLAQGTPRPVDLITGGLQAESTAHAAQETAQVFHAQQTAQAAGVTRAAYEANLQQTAASADVTRAAYETGLQLTARAGEMTRQAESTTTAQAWALMQWTAEADRRRETVEAQHTAEAWQFTRTAVVVNANETQTASEYIARTLDRNERRQELTNTALALVPYVLGFVAVAALLWGVFFAALRLLKTPRVIQRGENGQAPVIVMGEQVLNIDRSLHPSLDTRHPQPTAPADQMRVTENEQKVELVRALAQNGRAAQAAKAVEAINGNALPQPPERDDSAALPVLAPWDALSSWDWRGGSLPLGVGPHKTGISLDPERTPHLLVAGASGAGKTMSGLRPIAALALVSGWQVVLMNEAGGDFSPLKGHANLITVPSGAAEIAGALESAVGELERRSSILNAAGVSTWSRMADAQGELGPRILIVIDELVALTQIATGTLSGRIWAAAIHITSMGRKTGLSMLIGTTDPTYRTLGQKGLIVRDNCGRMVFHLRDSSSSIAALNQAGAELLPEHHFLAQFDSAPIRGAAFRPEDQQIRAFLAAHPSTALPAPAWLAAQSSRNEEQGRDARIRELAAQGRSLNEIQREVFGYTGGSAYDAVRAVLDGSTTGNTTGTGTTLPVENQPQPE